MSFPSGAVFLCLTAIPLLAAAQSATAALPDERVSLPVEHVTVFGDRARVTRAGRVTPRDGRVVLPLLPVTVEPASIRVEGKGLEVTRVSVRRVERAELPEGEARSLIEAIDEVERELQAIDARLSVIEEERRFVQSLQPRATPVEGAIPTALSFEPSGWTSALGFLDGRAHTLASAVVPVQAERLKKIRALERLQARARQLLAHATARPGYEVVAQVKGREGSLELVYVAANARWFPRYDVRFDPDAQQVSLALGALVSQETGEDWTDARLTLSTAVPAATSTLPQLSVWKIGDRERFIPTPEPLPQPLPPRPAPWRPAVAQQADTQASLREELQAAVAPFAGARLDTGGGAGLRVGPLGAGTQGESSYARSTAPPTPSASPPRRASRRPERVSMSAASLSESADAGASVPTEAVSFAAPGAWRPPPLPPDSPSMLAGGYAFTYDAARRETITSGTRDAQVALSTVSLPATAVVRILPALSADAFLVTEVTNTTERPLFKGKASLFVGADLVGEAEVPTTPRGAKVTLPLGIDDAISVERHVQVTQSEQGVFAKDDVSVYDVEIELLNPRSKPVQAVVVDQVPLQKGEKVKVTLVSASPELAKKPDADGLLEWKVELRRGEKQVLKFRYSVVRPKDWKLWQQSQPKGGR